MNDHWLKDNDGNNVDLRKYINGEYIVKYDTRLKSLIIKNIKGPRFNIVSSKIDSKHNIETKRTKRIINYKY